MRQLVCTMFISNNPHRFTCGERKIWWNIKKSPNIMKMIEGSTVNQLQSLQCLKTPTCIDNVRKLNLCSKTNISKTAWINTWKYKTASFWNNQEVNFWLCSYLYILALICSICSIFVVYSRVPNNRRGWNNRRDWVGEGWKNSVGSFLVLLCKAKHSAFFFFFNKQAHIPYTI